MHLIICTFVFVVYFCLVMDINKILNWHIYIYKKKIIHNCIILPKNTNGTINNTIMNNAYKPDVKPSAINSLSRSAHVFSMSIWRCLSVTVSRSGLLNVPAESHERTTVIGKISNIFAFDLTYLAYKIY